MDNQLKELFGSWIQAIGTVISAIGSTPTEKLSQEMLKSLNLWGNVLQGTGNAHLADAEESFSLGKLGNEIQAIGNTAVIAGIVIDFDEEIKQRLDINGNWLQAAGAGISIPDSLKGEPSSIRTLNIAANVLQMIGNSLQAIGGTWELKNDREDNEKFKGYKENNHSNQISYGQSLGILGSWIQAVGAVIQAIVQSNQSS